MLATAADGAATGTPADAGGGAGDALWSAILITIVAAAGNNIGKALQKQATRHLPRLALRPDVARQYFTSGTWLLGMAADLGGAVLMIAAFARAPVSVVQPVSSVGLVFLMIFSHFYLKERLQPHEWAAAATAGIGVLLLGASSEPEASGAAAPSPPGLQPPLKLHEAAATGTQEPAGAPGTPVGSTPGAVAAAAASSAAAGHAPGALRVLVAFVILLSLLAAEIWWRAQRQSQRRRRGGGGLGHVHPRAGDEVADAAACGLEAGACFGFSAAACRTGFQLAPSMGWLLVPAGLAASIGLTSSGFVLQTRGLKHGKAVVVCTLAAASSMVSGVLVGLVALGEQLPRSNARRFLRLVSWVLILGGVTNLSSGGGSGEGGGSSDGAGSGGSTGRSGALRRLEDAARGSRLPHRLKMWLLAALHTVAGLSRPSDEGGKWGGKGAGLISNGHSDDGPALPVAMQTSGGLERQGSAH